MAYNTRAELHSLCLLTLYHTQELFECLMTLWWISLSSLRNTIHTLVTTLLPFTEHEHNTFFSSYTLQYFCSFSYRENVLTFIKLSLWTPILCRSHCLLLWPLISPWYGPSRNTVWFLWPKIRLRLVSYAFLFDSSISVIFTTCSLSFLILVLKHGVAWWPYYPGNWL